MVDEGVQGLFNLVLRDAIQVQLGLLAKLESGKHRRPHSEGLADQDRRGRVMLLDDGICLSQELSVQYQESWLDFEC